MAKNHTREIIYEANKSHKNRDRKTKVLRVPKSTPYRKQKYKQKYRLTAYDYLDEEEFEY